MRCIIAILPVAIAAFTGVASCDSKDAKFIGAGAEAGAKPAYVRHEVVNEKAVVNAEWCVAGLGVFTPAVNMKRVSSVPYETLMPGYTHFKKRRHEISIDVTPQWNCEAGATNVLSAVVTSGWWCDGLAGKNGGTWPAFRGLLKLSYSDGTTAACPTDESWIVTTDTPFVKAGIWEGEAFDATRNPVTDDVSWEAAKVSNEFGGVISPRTGPPVIMRMDLLMFKEYDGENPIPYCGQVKPGETNVIDFGQNCAGVPNLQFSAEAGTKVTVKLAEFLNDGIKGHHGDGPKGTVYMANMRGAPSIVEYVCKGGKDQGDVMESYTPLHTFYGYRYAAISADRPLRYAIASVPISSVSKDMERGWVETGVERVNRLIKNAYWGMLSNYLSVPTDCPQRTERLGWTGDAQVFAKTGTYFADISAFMEKWMQDVRDSQRDDGIVPVVAPLGPFGGDGPNAGWSDAVVMVPYTIWKQLGDEKIVHDNWEAMSKFVAAVLKSGYTTKRGQWLTGDWLSFENLTIDNTLRWAGGALCDDHLEYQNFLNACHLYQDLLMMGEMCAGISGLCKMDYLEDFAAAASAAKSRILERWFKPDGSLIDLFNGMQTPALFALRLGLGDRVRNSAALVESIHANGDRLSTGFLGTPLLCEVLSDIGESRLAYTLLLQREFPSWLHSVDQGATTVWERWNGYTREHGFGPWSAGSSSMRPESSRMARVAQLRRWRKYGKIYGVRLQGGRTKWSRLTTFSR